MLMPAKGVQRHPGRSGLCHEGALLGQGVQAGRPEGAIQRTISSTRLSKFWGYSRRTEAAAGREVCAARLALQGTINHQTRSQCSGNLNRRLIDEDTRH